MWPYRVPNCKLGRWAFVLAAVWLAACAPSTAPSTTAPTLTAPIPPPATVTHPPGRSTPTELPATRVVGATLTPRLTPGPGVTPLANGCPAQQTPAGVTPPNVVLGMPNTGSGSASLSVGQMLEVRLGARMIWMLEGSGTMPVLVPAAPNGWFDATQQACVWRFTGQAPGQATLTFTGRALCPKGSLCPQFLILSKFEITVTG